MFVYELSLIVESYPGISGLDDPERRHDQVLLPASSVIKVLWHCLLQPQVVDISGMLLRPLSHSGATLTCILYYSSTASTTYTVLQ